MEKYYPLKLKGFFDLGFALGHHTYVGTQNRTPLGEKLYRFKYQKQEEYLNEITEIAVDFIKKNKQLNITQCIIPVPPSEQRQWQPVFLIAKQIGEKLNKFYAEYIIKKVHKTPELKNIENDYNLKKETIKNAFDFYSWKSKNYVNNKRILIIDDLYDTGATADELSKLLKIKGKAKFVAFLSITKTRGR